MSSPNSAGGTNGSAVIREGTRVILREITANLQNSPPAQSPRRKSGNESIKGEQQHDVKVRFIREFADAAATGREGNTESSLSSASSFQSLTSTLSSKCSSGICVDSSPAKVSDTSYVNADVSGLDDLISACENIRLTDKTLDLSKDQSFNLELEGEDLSDDQTFISAVDRNSLDRTREIFEAVSPVNVPPDVTQDLEKTRTFDGDEGTSTANAYFECGTVDIVEASRYTQANSELGSVSENFVQCVSNLAEAERTLDGNARDKLGVTEFAKNDKTHENLVNDKDAENLQVDNGINVGNSTLSLHEFTGNSTGTLEPLSDIIEDNAAEESEEIGSFGTAERKEGAEKPAQSVLDVTVDFPSDLKQFESTEPTRESEVADKPAQSVLDATVDCPSDLKQFESTEYTRQNEVAEKPAQSVLDVTVDFPSDLKQFESTEYTQRNEVAEKPAQSVLDATVDCPSDLKQFESTEYTRRNEVAEKPAQSILDVTVDCPSDLKQFESTEYTRRNEVAEKPAQSVLDVTVDFPSDLKQFESTEYTQRNEGAEKQAQSVLDVTVDFPSDLKQFESTEPTRQSEVAETPTQSVLDDTVDLPDDLKEIESIETPQLSEVAENPVQSTLFDSTVDIPSNFQEIADTQPSDIKVNEQIQPKSLSDLVVDDIPSVDSHECYKPLTSALSELNDNSRSSTLPTLSSICLRDPFLETDAPLSDQAVEKTQSTEDNIPTVAVQTLSEKFANIAAIDIPYGDSISTIQAPTFLNAQKLVEDSTEHNSSALKSEAALSENIGKTVDSESEIVQKIEKFIEPPAVEACEFKKPSLPVQTAKSKIVSLGETKKEDEESNIQSVDAVNAEKHVVPEIVESHAADSSTGSEDLNETVTIQDISAGNIFAVAESDQYAEFLPQQQSTALTLEGATVKSHNSGSVANAGLIVGDNLVTEPISLPDDYAAFVPQQQSTTLTGFADRKLHKLERQETPFVTAPLAPIESVFGDQKNKSPKPTLPVDDRCNFEKLELAAKAVANDIYNTSLEIEEDNTQFTSATSELFHDPESFDFLISKTPRRNTNRDLRAESLYVKFDPLVSNTSMLPQGNIQNTSPPLNVERNGDNNTTISNIGTPKRNPAIAAIDRLLFYSPMTTTTSPTSNTANIQKANDSQEKMEPTEETSAETINMAKELELVRSTVIQLEEQLEKLKIDHQEALEKQTSYQEKINQLQTQLAQEIKNKNQITVVVDEYEKSISRLVAEKERDRKNLDLEKARLHEELAAVKSHLENSEAAFNDVHLKYERLKAVAAAYKSNEVALKQSAQKNVEIIKTLEFRNEQVKEHATARLEKANQDLDAMLKQHESEKVRLHAMVKKAELKSKSLAELVEQKTKENKELTGILDEVIARVGRNKSE